MINIERGLIGLCLLHGSEAVQNLLRYDLNDHDFAEQAIGSVWKRIANMYAQNRVIDMVSIEPECPDIPLTWWTETADASGGLFLHDAFELVQIAKQLRRKHEAEALLPQWATRIKNAPASEVDNAIAEIIKQTREIQAPMAVVPSFGELCDAQVQEWTSPTPSHTLLPWHLSRVNEFVGRVRTEYILIAAQPGLGKTALALNWAVSLAHLGHPVAFRSLESNTASLLPRLVAAVGQIDTIPIREHRATPETIQKAVEALDTIKRLPLAITDQPATIEGLRVWADSAKQAGAKALVIDNLRHIRPSQKYQSPIEMYRDYSLKLKWLRDDVQLPLMVLHHTNTQGELAWSSDIERDADIVLTMSTDEDADQVYEGKPIGPTKVQIKVVKNRHGQAHQTIEVWFDKKHQTLCDEQNSDDGVRSEIFEA